MERSFDRRYCCRACGLLQDDLPWGEDGNTPTFTICDCCGTEFGYDDCTKKAIIQSRKRWLSNGAEWQKLSAKPQAWNLSQQLSYLTDVDLK